MTGKVALDEITNDPRVKIRDSEAVEKKLNALISGGVDKFQVFSDFDFTISRLWLDDASKGPSSHGVVERALPTEFAVKCKNIFNTYYPEEINPNLSIEEKTPKMIEWWTATHSTLVASSFVSKDTLGDICGHSGIVVRDGFDAFAKALVDDKVPLLVFSAGIADVLEGVLDALGLAHPNQTVIGNRMQFDSKGRLIGFQEPLIHVFNKNDALKQHLDYFESQKSRANAILMGDSLGDLRMVEGVDSVTNCLTIGFLNTKVEEMMETYMDSYDIVLVDDRTMDLANKILRLVKHGV